LFTTITVLSLALGIGANTAIFSLLDRVLLRTLPVLDPSELVNFYSPGVWEGMMSTDEDGGPSFSYRLFREMQANPGPFVAIAGARSDGASLSYNNQATHGTARLVSGNYFELLGVQAAIGRVLTDDDDRAPVGRPVIVLSYGYWQSRFGGDPGVLNTVLTVNSFPMTIVGVVQKGFLSERLGDPPEVYAPLSVKEQITPDWRELNNRQYAWVTMLARLKPGMTRERAEIEINVPYRAQIEKDVALLTQPSADVVARFRARTLILRPGEYGRGGPRDRWREPLWLMMGMTMLVLLIACANAANLQLARAAARRQEVAVRLAMGASRRQLVRHLLTESCVLALAGGALGLLGANWTLRAILASLHISPGLESLLSAQLDARVLAFSIALSLATGILFGLFPALRASRPGLTPSLNEQPGQISAAGGASLLRKTLVAAQVAIALLLLISGGLFARSLINLTRINLGLRADHLMTFSVLPKLNRYSDERIELYRRQLTDRLEAIPGVRLVTSARIPAVAGSAVSASVTVEGYNGPDAKGAKSALNVVGENYFRTLGVPLIVGREFTRADVAGRPAVAVVNEAFVRQFFPNRQPLGMRMARGSGVTKLGIEIVGVVKDAKYAAMRESPPPVYYMSFSQGGPWGALPTGPVHFYLRTAVEPQSLAAVVRRVVAGMDPNMPIQDMKTMERQIEENLYAERIVSFLTGAFAALATLLAAIGLYGVLAYSFARRTREIGIRMALGAGTGRVGGLVIREVVTLLAAGTLVGAGAALAAGRLVESMLYGLKPWDAVVYGGAVGALWLVAIAAAWIPARRATSVDPMVALRYE
jgi:predicted permease